MTQRTRTFLIGAALIVVVGLCTGLVAYYSGNLPLRSRAIGPAELSYVPADTGTLGYANVRAIMDSEFRQQLHQVLPTGKEKDRLLAETGIDVERDIDSVLAGLAPGESNTSHSVFLVRGRFDAARLEALATQHGARVEQYKDKRLLVLPGSSVPQSQGAPQASAAPTTPVIAFLESGLLAFGDDAHVKRAIDAAANRAGVTTNTELMKFVGNVSASGDAWLVSSFDAISNNTNVPRLVKDQMSSVQWLWLTADVDRTVSGRLSVETRDDQGAEQLRSVVNGALGAAKMVFSRDARLEGMFNSLQVSGVGKNVDVSFVVPVELLGLLGGLAGGAPAPGQ